MGSYADLVNAEAVDDEEEDEAEASLGEPTADEDDDQQAEANAEVAVPTADEVALEKELTRHRKAVQKALGDGFEAMTDCPTCYTLGYVPHGLEPEPELLEDENLAACPACNGYGQVITGSRNEQYFTTQCTRCAGTGYRDKAAIAADAHARTIDTTPPSSYPPPQPVPIWDAGQNAWVIPPPANMFGTP